MTRIRPIHRVEISGYLHFDEFIRMLKAEYDEAVHLCEIYGVMSKSIRVGIIGPEMIDGTDMAVEFCVPGLLYEQQEKKKLEAGETKEEE